MGTYLTGTKQAVGLLTFGGRPCNLEPWSRTMELLTCAPRQLEDFEPQQTHSNYLGIVLNGGENSTIVFSNKIQPQSDSFCVSMEYRKGPNKYDDEMSNEADEVFYIPELNYTVSQPLQGYPNPTRQQFSTFNITLSWDKQTEMKLSFAVPPGKPAQFFNVKKILAVDGSCQN
ncbi:UNVERIFIED_CONTAM: CRISP/Allergen/PR-1 [Trichonephila clavipes]